MRSTLLVACVLILVFSSSPVSGQLRTDAAKLDSEVRLYDAGGSGLSLNKYFSPSHFKMSHSFELSSSSGFGGGYGGGTMGMYTNSMMWQFNSKLAARVDVAMAYSPDGGGSTTGALNSNALNGGNNGRIFLRNAEVAYRPTENMLLHFSVRQSPYGNYMSPYGNYYGGYDRGYARDTYSSDQLFWNNRLK